MLSCVVAEVIFVAVVVVAVIFVASVVVAVIFVAVVVVYIVFDVAHLGLLTMLQTTTSSYLSSNT